MYRIQGFLLLAACIASLTTKAEGKSVCSPEFIAGYNETGMQIHLMADFLELSGEKYGPTRIPESHVRNQAQIARKTCDWFFKTYGEIQCVASQGTNQIQVNAVDHAPLCEKSSQVLGEK